MKLQHDTLVYTSSRTDSTVGKPCTAICAAQQAQTPAHLLVIEARAIHKERHIEHERQQQLILYHVLQYTRSTSVYLPPSGGYRLQSEFDVCCQKLAQPIMTEVPMIDDNYVLDYSHQSGLEVVRCMGLVPRQNAVQCNPHKCKAQAKDYMTNE